ncbi:hypothetical protein J1N35_045257 [Gossypium stocksii]|uniref:Uncharacterized protein n=1 Tax=Gossypium stocksii TaxID=47602 RepID=A0A9D3ZH80_9ROSI|nr:hypothetical protein J1N35_045257 [Gossypium stocksii]
MYNVDLSQDGTSKFPDLPHRRRDRTSSSLDLGELEVGVSEDHPKMDSDMLATLILPTVKVDPRTSVPLLIANIRSQLRLMRHICPQPNICVISDQGTEILAAIEQQGSLWHHTHHQYCLRYIASNYYRQFRSTSEK